MRKPIPDSPKMPPITSPKGERENPEPAPTPGHARADGTSRLSDILILGVWFGLVSGLLEGVGLLTFQRLGWLNWSIAKEGVTIEIVWVSALFDLLFCLLGVLGLVLLRSLFRRWPWLSISVFCFAFFLFLDLLMLSGHIQRSGELVLAVGLAVTVLRWFRRNEEAALRFWRRSLPWVVALFLFAWVGIQGGKWWQEQRALANLPPAQPGAPNVLVIVVDTLRADHLGAYGYTRATSPNIDQLAREGILFENAISTSSWTLPSHASLLTGRYPYEHGAVKARFPDRYPTLAEFLRDRGYRTGAISANKIWFARSRGFGRGFIHFEDYFDSMGDMFARTIYGRKIQKNVLIPLGYEDDPGRKRAPEVTAAALNWIEKGARRPFFLFLNYYDPHDPYLPPQPYRSKFSKKENPGGRLNTLLLRYYPGLTPEQLQDEMDAYDGAIAYADHSIGELMAGLEERGLAANTLVVLVADHGESFGEHGLLIHYNALYRETLHVPMILRWPGHLPAGSRVAPPVSLAAVPATLLDLLGEGDQKIFPGPSVVRMWGDAGSPLPDYLPLSELADCPYKIVKKNPCYSGEMKSLASPEWHYITHEKLGEELYHWKEDPQELENVANSAGGQVVASDFRHRLGVLLAGSKNSRTQR